MALVKCPDCGRDVSDAAPTCPGCGRPMAGQTIALQAGQAAAPAARKKTSAGTLGCAIVLLLALGWCVSVMLQAPAPTAPRSAGNATPASAAPMLELESWTWSRSEGGSHAIAEGRVKNISGQSLKSVQVVVTFATDSGQMITSDNALIEYNPILPGQVSPFKVYATWNPAMKKAGIDFKELFGPTIPWRQRETKGGPKGK